MVQDRTQRNRLCCKGAGDHSLEILQPQARGETGQETFSLMSLWVPMIMQPVWELGLDLDANDASKNARNRKSSMGIG